jgi:hypothetical protein
VIDFTNPGNILRTAKIVDERGNTYSTPLPFRTGGTPTAWVGVWFDRNTREWVVAVYEDYRCSMQTGESYRSTSREWANEDAMGFYTTGMVALAQSMAAGAA